MSLSESKCRYSNNCLCFLKRAVPLNDLASLEPALISISCLSTDGIGEALTFSKMTLSIMINSVMILSITILSITIHSIMILSTTILSIMILRITVQKVELEMKLMFCWVSQFSGNTVRHNAKWHYIEHCNTECHYT